MEGVEATSSVIDQSPPPVAVEAPPVLSEDDALAAVWDKVERDHNAARDDSGKFTSGSEKPLEGGQGEEAKTVAEPSTPETVDVPLPSNWNGKEELWAKVPKELKEPVRTIFEELHQKQSQLGREAAAYKPVNDVIGKYKDYFGGERGNYKPHEAIDYMFALQRSMDDRPLETLMEIADRYNLRDQLTQQFGGQAQAPETNTLLKEIGELKATIRQMGDPSRVDERITQKLHEDRMQSEAEQLMSRVKKDTPLADQVSDEMLTSFINMAWSKLGNTASQENVLKTAYDMAINADPDLRTKAAALKAAAANDPGRVAAAKRANETNIRSTSTDKGRKLTEEEELGMVWEKAQRG